MLRLSRMFLGCVALLAATAALPAVAGETLTLAEAWRRVQAAHPDFAAAEAAVAASDAVAAQAGRALNPELALDVENFAGSGEFARIVGAEVTLSVAQTWTLGGKARLRRAEAVTASRQARFAATAAAQAMAADLTRAFVGVLAAQRRVALADTAAGIAARDRAAVDRRVAAGAESRIESQRFLLAAANARRASDRAREDLQAARRRLAALWGDDGANLPPAAGPLDSLVVPPPWEDVAALADSAPAVRLAALACERAAAAAAVARSLGSIDLTTAAGWRHFRGTGDNAVVASIALPLPLRDKNRDGIRAAGLDVVRAEAEVAGARLRLRTQLSATWSRLATARADAEAIRGEILPAAAAAMREAEHAYAVGRFSLTDVLAVRHDWAVWETELVDALVRHHTAAADLAALLGAPPFTPILDTEVTP